MDLSCFHIFSSALNLKKEAPCWMEFHFTVFLEMEKSTDYGLIRLKGKIIEIIDYFNRKIELKKL